MAGVEVEIILTLKLLEIICGKSKIVKQYYMV
jgi:hypothetical protein